jgi:hypothetical protein
MGFPPWAMTGSGVNAASIAKIRQKSTVFPKTLPMVEYLFICAMITLRLDFIHKLSITCLIGPVAAKVKSLRYHPLFIQLNCLLDLLVLPFSILQKW